MKFRLLTLALTFLFMGAAFTSFGQTKEECVTTFNKGVELSKANDLAGAVASLVDAHKMAVTIGEEANDIKDLAAAQIPQLQFGLAATLANEKKYDEAIEQFKLAYEYADTYGNADIKSKVAEFLPRLYLAKAGAELNAKNYEAALSLYDDAIKYNPNLHTAYFYRGLACEKLERADDFRMSIDSAIVIGTRNKDAKVVDQARRYMTSNLLDAANQSLQANKFDAALKLVEQSLAYTEENLNAYYISALANNRLSNWDAAISAAEKGIALEEKVAAKQARFYYELATAQAGKGQTSAACASFKKAAVGPYADNANYQIKTVLKCK